MNCALRPRPSRSGEHLAQAQGTLAKAERRVRLLDAATGFNTAAITGAHMNRLATRLRQALRDGDPAFRKADLRLFVDQVVVGDGEIRMSGRTVAQAEACQF